MGPHTIVPAQAQAGDILDSIRRIVRALRTSSAQSERAAGLSAAQLFVLSRLDQTPATSLNELAQRTLTHQSSASVVVSRLVERGLVRRRRCGNDGRRWELSVTARGRAALKAAPRATQDQLIDVLLKMPQARLRTLAALLREVVEAAGMDGEAPMFFEDVEPRRKGARR